MESSKQSQSSLSSKAAALPSRGAIFSTGIIAGLIVSVMLISIVSLIFTGPLFQHFSLGVRLIFISGIAMTLVIAWRSAYPGAIGYLQPGPAVIMGISLGNIAMDMRNIHSPEEVLATSLALISITALLTGISLYFLGRFRLIGLIRFFPYPVLGAFLAATGILIFRGGLKVMAPTGSEAGGLDYFFGPDALLLFWPGMILALILYLAMRFKPHPLLLPLLALIATVLFYGGLYFSGTSPAEAAEMGLLMTFNSPDSGLALGISDLTFGDIRWEYIPWHLGAAVTIVMITIIDLLISVNAFEVAAREEMDVNREFEANGLGNLASGLLLGPVGQFALSLTRLGTMLKARHRAVGLIVALVCLLPLLFGLPLIGLIPKLVLGGLVCFIGLGFIVDWLYDAWFSMNRQDYFLMIFICGIIVFFGFLEGVGIGILLALGLFALNYSRVGVIRHQFSGKAFRSNVGRTGEEEIQLTQKGEEVEILQLGGFIFFGTADKLFTQIRNRVISPDLMRLKYLILDFKNVSRVDSSCVNNFIRIRQVLEGREINLIFSDVPDFVRTQMEKDGFYKAGEQEVQEFRDLDHAMEWCENQLIRKEDGRTSDLDSGDFHTLPELLPQLRPWLEMREAKAGEQLIDKGKPSEALYFIYSGKFSASIQNRGGREVRLRVWTRNTVVGESGFYLGTPASASVFCHEAGEAGLLSRESLEKMEKEAPLLAEEFHKIMVRILARRLNQTTELLHKVMDQGGVF